MKRKTANRIQLQQALVWDIWTKSPMMLCQSRAQNVRLESEAMENFTGAEALPVMNGGEHPWFETSPHHIQEDFLVWFGVFVGLCWVFCLFVLAFHPFLL